MSRIVRGLRLPFPIGSNVISKQASEIIIPEKLDIADEDIALIEGQAILGIARFKEGVQVEYEDHMGMWPDAKQFFMYSCIEVEAFESPITYDVPPDSGLLIDHVPVPDCQVEKSDEKVEITILGTKGMIEERGRKHASLLLSDGTFRLRIDKGDEDSVQYDALVITHAHPDHVGGIQEKEIFYGTEHVKRVFEDRVHLLPYREPVRIGPFSITAYPVLHSTKAPASALRVEWKSGAIAYAPDILGWTSKEDRWACLDRVNLFFGDGSHPSGVFRRSGNDPIGHASWRTQLSWAKEAEVQEVIFTHLGEKTIHLIRSDELNGLIGLLEDEYGLKIMVAEDGKAISVVRKLDLARFRSDGIDYDIENAALRWRELLADLRYLANSGYARLKAGKPWGDWTLNDVARYFGKIVDTLRGLHFPLIPPAEDDPRSRTPYWELYRLAEKHGFISTNPPSREETKEWDKKREAIIKSNLAELHMALPDYVLIIPDWASLSGSLVYGQHLPNDADVILKSSAPSGSLLKIQRALQTKTSLPVQFVVDESGPSWDFMPLYDLVAVKAPFSIQMVREGVIARELLYKSLRTNPDEFRPGIPIKHYEVAGEFYVPQELERAWETWGKKVIESGDKIYVNPKFDGIRFIFSWDGKKAYLFTEKGEDRTSAFPGIEKLAKKIGTSFVLDTEFVEFDSAFDKQISRTLMTWMATGKTPKLDAKIKVFVHDIAYLNGKNVASLPYLERWALATTLIQRPIKLGRFRLELAETYVVDSYDSFKKAVNEFRVPIPGRSTEGAMAKASSFRYDPLESRTKVIKLKNRIEIDALILGYREMPKAREPGKRLGEEEAFELLKKRTGVYSFRLGLVDEKTGRIVPIESKKKLSETDLTVSWDEENQRWKGLDDPRLWTMFFGLPHRKAGEYAYGNSYSVACDCTPKQGMILTVSPMEITTWEDDGLHVSLQHPIPVGIKEKGHEPSSIQDALVAHKKVLPKKDFAVFIALKADE